MAHREVPALPFGQDRKTFDQIAEPRQQPRRLPALDETVEPKAIDQKMRHFSPRCFHRHMTIQLLVDDLDLVSRHRPGIFVGGAKRAVVEKKLPPDVRTDQRKILPGKAEFLARTRWSGRIVLLPEADAPLTFMMTGRSCGDNGR